MKKEDFTALGIDEKLAKKAAEASKKELSGYVPKDRFDEVNESKKKLETSAKEHETQMETLKAAAGDNEELKKQISDLQNQNKKKEAEYQEQIKDMKLTNAIKLAVSGSAQDCDLVAGLIDKGKLILGDDGKVTGLEEQVKALKESKGFLFREEKKTEDQRQTGFRIGSTKSGSDSGETKGKPTMKDAIAAALQTGTRKGDE